MKKSILIAAFTIISAVTMAQSTKKVSKHMVDDTTKTITKIDSISVSVDDFKSLLKCLSGLVNNSSDITTKQANAKGGPNEILGTLYFKYFPKETPKQ